MAEPLRRIPQRKDRPFVPHRGDGARKNGCMRKHAAVQSGGERTPIELFVTGVSSFEASTESLIRSFVSALQ